MIAPALPCLARCSVIAAAIGDGTAQAKGMPVSRWYAMGGWRGCHRGEGR